MPDEVFNWVPPQCSEREAGGQEDCTWCTGVMLNNAAHGRTVVRSVRSEYEALRVAGGDGPAENPGDGSNYKQLELAIKRRYDWDIDRYGHIPFATFWRMLTPGMAAGVQGTMGVFPRMGRWRRWDRQFGSFHSVYVQRRDTSDRVWWMNPSAPNTYAGEWMNKADLKRYYEAWVGGIVMVKVGKLFVPPDTSTEDPMGMKLAAKGPVIGKATMVVDWHLWRVRDDMKTAKKPKGTKFDVRGIVTYHMSKEAPAGYTGYLVSLQGEDHILPTDRVSTLKVTGEL